MKKIVIIAMALFALQINAQERGEKRADRPDFTPEEIAGLQTKQMTLDLDLTEAQQEKVRVIVLKNATTKKAMMEAFKNKKGKTDGEKPSKEEMLKMKHEMLDAQIANKQEMKQVLNEEQFKKWEKKQDERQAMRGKKKKMMREHGDRNEQKPHLEDKN
jgi:protein CpxP